MEAKPTLGGPCDCALPWGHGEVITPVRVSQRSGGGVDKRGTLSKAPVFICFIFHLILVSASDQDYYGLLLEKREREKWSKRGNGETERKREIEKGGGRESGRKRESLLLQIRLEK